MKGRTGESMMDSDLADTIEPDADMKALVGPFGARWDAGVVHERSHAECLGVAPLSPRHIDNVIAVITPTEAAWPTSYVRTTVHHLRLSSDPFGNPRTRWLLSRHGRQRDKASHEGYEAARDRDCSGTA